jgi:hypothetical protein
MATYYQLAIRWVAERPTLDALTRLHCAELIAATTHRDQRQVEESIARLTLAISDGDKNRKVMRRYNAWMHDGGPG